MKVSKWVALASAAMLFGGQALAGPFGIEMGMTIKELGESWQEVSAGLYKSGEAPKPHSAFETYVVKVSPSHGVCWIKAIGNDISTNRHGLQLKSAFSDMRDKLTKVYGPSELTDLLLPGSIWDEPEDWMMAIIKKERYLMAQWGENEGAALRDNVTMIGLIAQATRSSTGYLTLEYYFSNKNACDSELEAAEDDAL